MAQFTLGKRVFPSKQAAAETVRLMLQGYAASTTVRPEHFDLLLALLVLHPNRAEKIGCGVQSIQVEQNFGSKGFWLTRIDGSRTDWSYRACFQPPTAEAEAKAALRNAIRDQATAFRNRAFAGKREAICAVTGRRVRPDEVHIDHDPPFEVLVQAFLRERGMTLEDVRVLPSADGNTETVLADVELARAWSEFHRAKAGLRVLARDAHIERHGGTTPSLPLPRVHTSIQEKRGEPGIGQENEAKAQQLRAAGILPILVLCRSGWSVFWTTAEGEQRQVKRATLAEALEAVLASLPAPESLFGGDADA